MKQHQLAATVAVSLGLVFTAVAQTQPSSQTGKATQTNSANRMKGSDDSFVTKAAQGGLAEVELGQLAVQKATNPKVKEFGQKMVDDHTKANDELKAIAGQKGLTMPTQADSKSESTKNKLSNLSGAAFDRAYMQDMVSDHKTDVSEFQKEADKGTDPEVKAFASKTLPTLQQHLQLAQETLNEVKSGGTAK